jgi:hypothetical protein
LLAGFAETHVTDAATAKHDEIWLHKVHQSLVAAVLRMLFVLFAEGRRLSPMDDERYVRHHSLHRLHDAMANGSVVAEHGGGAWQRVGELWRFLHGGGTTDRGVVFPQRGGHLFDVTAHASLEDLGTLTISDRTVFLTLDALLVSGSRRVDYATLDVEELGAAYEGILGLELRVAHGNSVMLSPDRAVVSLDDLLAKRGSERVAALKKDAHIPLGNKARAVDNATSVEGLRAALARWGACRPAARVAEGTWFLRPGKDRRRSGSHYTPRPVTARVVAAALRPLFDRLGPSPSADAILALRVCDPAMGGAAFLLEACRVLGDALLSADRSANGTVGIADNDDDVHRARRAVARHCLYGVDKNPLAVDLARLSIWLLAHASSEPFTFLDHALKAGDALIGSAPNEVRTTNSASVWVEGRRDFHWRAEFPDIFGCCSHSGFDAILGNPPWVSYAGRAAQPLDPDLRAHYKRHFASFAGYRNLQGLFIERSVSLLAEGGRLGLVVPSSMSELDGYAPTRLAHDQVCVADADLPDLGDCFASVFQPCMALCSTRRGHDSPLPSDAAPTRWAVERPDLTPIARELLKKMDRPPLPRELFGERGLQSTGEDALHIRAAEDALHTIPLRSGSDIDAFARRAPSQFANATWFATRLRRPAEWQRVKVLVRQTAAFPKAATSDGEAFRNSILAGFDAPEYPAAFLVAYLSSSLIRWLHYTRHRDARQGMPQVKIGHLRAVPAPPSRRLVDALATIGSNLSARNTGIADGEQAAIDALVEGVVGFDLSDYEQALIRRWAAEAR